MTCRPIIPISRANYALIMIRSNYGCNGSKICCPSDIKGIPASVEILSNCPVNTYEGCKECWLGVFDKAIFKGD